VAVSSASPCPRAINRSGLSKAVCVDGRCLRVRELPQTQNGVVAADAPVRALRKKQKVGRLRALRSRLPTEPSLIVRAGNCPRTLPRTRVSAP
jgi:hypothetical protein